MAEASIPSGFPPEAVAPEVQPNQTPPRSIKRVLALVAGGLIVILLLVAVVWGFTFLLRDSVEDGELASTDTPVPTSPLRPQLPPHRQLQPNLFVQVQRNSEASFGVDVLQVRRTYSVPTVQDLEPAVEDPHSLVQLLSANGTPINEFRFSIPTTVTLEIAGQPGVPYALPPSPYDMYIPVPENAVPAKVRIVTPQREVLIEQDINYETLPQDKTPEDYATGSGLQAWLEKLGFLNHVSAQQQGEVVIAVTHHQGGNLAAVEGAAHAMVAIVSPWTMFAPITRIEAVPLAGQDLGCITIQLPVGEVPACPNAGAVIAAVAPEVPDWDVIGVAVDVNCDCGSALFNSKVAAVGNFISAEILAHEFAHAMPQALADEYLGDLGQSGPGGENCFASGPACENALNNLFGPVNPLDPLDPNLPPPPGLGLCTLGCNTPFTWRPASQLMYNVPGGFGPYEHELVCRNIANAAEPTCDDARDGFPDDNGGGGGGGGPLPIPTFDPGADPGGDDPPGPQDPDDPGNPDFPGGPTSSDGPTPTPSTPGGDPPQDPDTPTTPGDPSDPGRNTGFFGGVR